MVLVALELIVSLSGIFRSKISASGFTRSSSPDFYFFGRVIQMGRIADNYTYIVDNYDAMFGHLN